MTSTRSDWTSVADIVARVRRRWDDGSLPGAFLREEPFEAFDIPLRGPAAGQITNDLSAVVAWQRALTTGGRHGSSYDVVTKAVGGRALGRNEIPARVTISTYAQAWRLLGVEADVTRLEALREATQGRLPTLWAWLTAHPLRALAVADDWPRVLDAVAWLAEHGGRLLYVRQIDVSGVDTKFVESHRGLIADLLDAVLEPERIDIDRSRGREFDERYGFLAPPRLLRLRVDAEFAGMPWGVSEVALRRGEAARLRLSVQHVLVVENLVTYLAAPVPSEGVVVWGEGYRAGLLGRLPWVEDAPRVTYAGDLDTHGFAILDQLRQKVPHTRSLLMDRATLLAHRERWGSEPSPTRAALSHLSEPERALYRDLVEDAFGPAVRLEQERLDWPWVESAFDQLNE